MSAALRFSVRSVGLLAPGLPDWQAGRQILGGEMPYRLEPVAKAAPDILPAAERRRASASVRVAIAAALEAVRSAAELEATEMASVFAASDSDGRIIHDICEVLAQSERCVSPTRFHNSVHNAPAGYWSIATRSYAASTSLSAYDFSFAAGLLEAAVQVATDDKPVLLVAFDLPLPPPLHALRPIDQPFAAALLLTPPQSDAAALTWQLSLEPGHEAPAAAADIPECLRNNPAARSWPWLAAIARQQAGNQRQAEIRLEYFDGRKLMLRSVP